MNLNTYIAKSGFCSRRKAAQLVKEGRVALNGRAVLEPWHDVKDGDVVKVGGICVKAEKLVYLAFNKPRGVTTTCSDRFAKRVITDLVPKSFGRLYPVGRLDKDSRGLIILTNDGDVCNSLTHPKYEIEKEYLVSVKGAFQARYVAALKSGVKDEGEYLNVKSAMVDSSSIDKSVVSVVVSEGKKRHLRRLFKRLGFTVTDLKRVRIGSIHLGDLKEGEYKLISRPIVYEGRGMREEGRE